MPVVGICNVERRTAQTLPAKYSTATRVSSLLNVLFPTCNSTQQLTAKRPYRHTICTINCAVDKSTNLLRVRISRTWMERYLVKEKLHIFIKKTWSNMQNLSQINQHAMHICADVTHKDKALTQIKRPRER